MKEHCVTVTQNYVRQLHWKIGGYVWQSTNGKREKFTQKKETWFRDSTTFLQLQINTSRAVPQIKQNQAMFKRGSKSSKLKEAARSSKVSLSEQIPTKQIKEISIWHTRVQSRSSKQFSQTAAGGNIERTSTKITISWHMRKH